MGLRGSVCIFILPHLPTISPVWLSGKKVPVSNEILLKTTAGNDPERTDIASPLEVLKAAQAIIHH